MACNFEVAARKIEVVVSISRPRCSQVCVGSHWPFLGLHPSLRRSSRDVTQSRSYRVASLLSVKNNKSSVYGSSRALLHL
jgi:hypothetical protein